MAIVRDDLVKRQMKGIEMGNKVKVSTKVEELKKKIVLGLHERLLIIMEERIPDYKKEKGVPQSMLCLLEVMAYEFACFSVAMNDGLKPMQPPAGSP